MSVQRMGWLLRLFLRTYGLASLVLFCSLFVAFAMEAPILATGGPLNWAIWDDVTDHVGPMLFVIYAVWAIFLIRAAGDPPAHATFLDFTLWANLGHGLLMIWQTTTSAHDFAKLFTDVPWILVLPLVLGGLRRAYSAPAAGAVGQG